MTNEPHRLAHRSFPGWLLGLLLLAASAAGAQTPTETLVFGPVADTYVDDAVPTKNFDTSSELRADAAPVRISYLRFAVTGVNGRPVEQARLRLGVLGGSVSGGAVHRISDTGWNAATVTFTNRPAIDGPALDSLGSVTVGAVAEFKLDGAILGDGEYVLAIDSSNADGVVYVSSAASSGQKPALVLTVTAAPAPTVRIVQPSSGAIFFLGDAVTLQGSAVDPDGVDLGAAIVWRSNLQGFLGTGPTLATTLLEGSHAVTATATDGAGRTAAAQIGVSVGRPPAADTPPLVAITSPLDGQTVAGGQPVVLTGSASDLEDGVLTARLAWTSDLDGPLGTGGTLSRTLSPGTHQIAASVTDSGGLIGSAAVMVTVRAPLVIEVTPTADAYVDAGSPSTNFGAAPVVKTDANILRIGYLRFVVAGAGNAVTRAVLRMQVDASSGAASDSGGTVRTISNHTWDERLVTYATRPALDGLVVASTGRVASGQVVDFDVSSAVTGNGTYDFALVNASSDAAEYRSREGGPAPKLIVTLAGNPPAVAITAPADGTAVSAGTPVTLAGTATDVEDGNLSATLAWTSSLDGVLGTGASVLATNLRPGTHVVTAAATDASGLRGEATVRLVVRPPDTPPTVTISAPAGGTVATAGVLLTLAGSAMDVEDGDVSSRLTWTSSVDGPLGGGASLRVALHAGTHTLTAAATDGAALRGEARVTITVRPPNTAPQVTIVAPVPGTVVLGGTPVRLAGTGTDLEDGDLSAALTWTSSLDGLVGRGASFTTSMLRPGRHGLTAAVTDREGLRGEARVELVVLGDNAPPAVAITSPASGSAATTATPVSCAATALDDFDGDLSASIVWTSSLQGVLGRGASLGTMLVAGTHVITATATDRAGLQSTARVSVTVTLFNTPPSLVIVAPRDGRTWAAGETATFLAAAEDVEDGLFGSRIAWSSDRDGALGVGDMLVKALSLGTHRITARVADSRGRETTSTITVTVVPPLTLAFTATADTYVSSSSPSTAYGTATKLVAEGSPIRQAFFRFGITGVAPNTVAQARLRLTVGSSSGDGSTYGGALYAISNTSWSESKTTYATRPAVDGALLGTQGAVKLNQVVEFDVTAAVKGNGTYSFALLSAATDPVRYRSRESSSGKPQLILTLSGSPRIRLTGTFSSAYTNGALAADTAIDASAATFLPSPLGTNYPVNLDGGPGVWVTGGAVLGQYDRAATWSEMHTFNGAGIVFANGQTVVDGLRIDNVSDAIRPKNGGNFVIRGVRVTYARDNCVENDHLHAGLVDDSLFDGCYAAFSARPSPTIVLNGANGSANVWRIERSLVRLEPMPGPREASADNLGHEGFFKWDSWDNPATSLSPKLALHGNVFMAERAGLMNAARMGIPPGQLASCSNNVMVWLGPGDYPAPLPACFTVTKDRSVWDAAVADWVRRHPQVRP